MKEKPILFKSEMVRAILRGSKTQTRRIGKIQRPQWTELGVDSAQHVTKGTILHATYRAFPNAGTARWAICECPYGIPGDHLWVKETFTHCCGPIEYKADSSTSCKDSTMTWKPSIFMRRVDSRITLEITEIRAERVQDISEEDAKAEGVFDAGYKAMDYDCRKKYDTIMKRDWGNGAQKGHYSVGFRILWDSINGKTHPWDSNPWVWVITFERK